MRQSIVVLLLVLFAPAFVAAQTPQGTAFTYQGELTQNAVPLAASVDLAFELFDAPTAGSQVGPTQTFSSANGNAVTPVDGVFTVPLDFGVTAFAGPLGAARWLRVTVNGNALSPRTRIENAPYALLARNAELAYAVPDASIGATQVRSNEVQLRGTSTSCAVGEVVTAIDADGNVTCAADADSGGDITGVTAGTGLTGGGTSGSVALSANTSVLQARVSGSCAVESSIRVINADGSVVCEVDTAAAPIGFATSKLTLDVERLAADNARLRDEQRALAGRLARVEALLRNEVAPR